MRKKNKEKISDLVAYILAIVFFYSLGVFVLWMCLPFFGCSSLGSLLFGLIVSGVAFLFGTYYLYEFFIEIKKIISSYWKKRKEKKNLKKKKRPKQEIILKIKQNSVKRQQRTILAEPTGQRESVKGQVMKELGLFYEKSKKKGNTKQTKKIKKDVIVDKNRENHSLIEKKIIYFLESKGILSEIETKGELTVQDNCYLGEARGKDILKKVSTLLKRIGIDGAQISGNKLLLPHAKNKLKKLKRSL